MVSEIVPELTNDEFSDFIKEGFVIIDFYAEWCMPCLMMGPILDDLSEKFKGKIKFGKVNVGDSPEIAQKYGVNSIPHFNIFKNGKIIETFNGAISSEEFEEKLKNLL